MSASWYEVWGDDTTDPPYLLTVRQRDDGWTEVVDPKTGIRSIFEAPTYDEVKLWLLEDEYVLVRGRMEV